MDGSELDMLLQGKRQQTEIADLLEQKWQIDAEISLHAEL